MIILTREKVFSFILLLSWLTFTILNLSDISASIYFILWTILILVALPFYFEKNITFSFSRVQLLWLLFILYTLLITIFNKNIGTQIIYKGKLITGNVQKYILPFIAIFLNTKLMDKSFFYRIFRDFLALCSMGGIFEFLTKEQWYKFLITSEGAVNNFNTYGNVALPNYRTTLIFYHPIYYGILMCCFFILLIYFPYKNKAIESLFLLLGILNLLFTQARSAWVVFLIILLGYLLKNPTLKNEKIKKYIFIAVGLIIGIILLEVLFTLLPSLQSRISFVLNNRLMGLFAGDSNAAGARLANWKLLDFRDTYLIRWIGGGDNYALTLLQLHPQIQSWINAVDNQYLTFLLNYGYLGLSIIVTIILTVIKDLLKIKDLKLFAIYLMIFSVLVGGYFFEFYTQSTIYCVFLIMICSTSNRDFKLRNNL